MKLCKEGCEHACERENVQSCGAKISRLIAFALRPRQPCRGITPDNVPQEDPGAATLP